MSNTSNARMFWKRLNAVVDSGLMSQLSPTEMLVFLCYLRRADVNGVGYPGNDSIARAVGHTDPRHVRRARAELVAKGFLECVHEGGSRPKDTSHFRVHIPPKDMGGESRPGAELAHGRNSPGNGGRNSPGNGGRNSPIEGTQGRNTGKEHNKCGDEPKGFTRFWELWPKHKRKVNRAGCLRHWQAANLESMTEGIISSLARWKASEDWRKQDGQFVPLPLTWLHQSRWTSGDPSMPDAGQAPSEIPTPETFHRAAYTSEIAALIGDPTHREVA
jgi:hypothetical protein